MGFVRSAVGFGILSGAELESSAWHIEHCATRSIRHTERCANHHCKDET